MMVVAGEKNYKHIDEGPIRKRTTRNADGDADDDEDNGMRVGPEYQALIPEFLPGSKPETKHEAMLVWSPNYDHFVDAQIEEYTNEAKEKHGYNAEQALGMLFWHKHNIEKALKDLTNFTPFPEDWSPEDKVLFEQAFSFHGKTFHKIKSMLPDKTVGSLVKYYYSWKKSRLRMSLIDKQVHKVNNKRTYSEDDESDVSSDNEYETNFSTSKDQKDDSKSAATNATSSGNNKQQAANNSSSSSNNTNTGKAGFGSRKILHDPHLRNKRRPPRGIHLNEGALQLIASGSTNQADLVLRKLDVEFVNLRKQVQRNKQFISAFKEKTKGGLANYRIPESSTKPVGKWTNEELLLAVQGVRKYGKNFKAIAEVIGNKSETLVRSFFINYRRRYNLDDVLVEYEREKTKMEGAMKRVDEPAGEKQLNVPEKEEASDVTMRPPHRPPPPTTTSSFTTNMATNGDNTKTNFAQHHDNLATTRNEQQPLAPLVASSSTTPTSSPWKRSA